MGDSHDKDRADRQRIAIESRFRVVELPGNFDEVAVESSRAAACADAFAAILTFLRSDNTSSHPKDKALSTSRDREVHRVHEEKNMSALIYSSREPLAHMKNTIHEKGVVMISVVSLI